MPLRVGVLGARGKTGREVCRALSEAPDLELVATVNRDDDLADLLSTEVHAVVDFTHPDVVMDSLQFCIAHGSMLLLALPASTTNASRV